MAFFARRVAVVASLLLVGGFAVVSGAAAADDAASLERGAYLATASDCTACHTAPGGAPFAGGLPIASPVGTIYATNITPSLTAGIGTYSEEDFARALREGIRKDGGHLYPAMPYTAYRWLSNEDIQDLYDYFMHRVDPVNVAPPRTSLPFPMNIRASMIAWNLLFLSHRRFVADPQQSAVWNRGAYLVEGPTHCGTCHTPRGLLMEELASQTLAGGQVGPWFAPNITSDPASGIASWTQADLVRYLGTGSLPDKARAAGDMGEAVEHSFQHLTPADLTAIAVYIRTVPAVHDKADNQSRFSYGNAVSALGMRRGKNGVASATDPSPSGAELFLSNCASCHAADGVGSKDGYYPSLIHNSATGAGNPDDLIATILYGVDRKISSGQAYMPGFGGKKTDSNQLDDTQISLLANYVFEQFGRTGAPISPSDVAQVRKGGPSSPLVLLARIGMAAGALVFLTILGLVIFRIAGRRRSA